MTESPGGETLSTLSQTEIIKQKEQKYDEDEEKKNQKKTKLLHWKDMPRHLQFNPYILTGYRPLLSAKECMHSLFYVHNETFNILSHAIPIIYILLIIPQILTWDRADLRFLAWCHTAGILCPWIGSFFYHLFMNIEKGPNIYYFLLKMDMIGIWVSQSFGAMPMISASTYCLPSIVRCSLITFYGFLSIWGLYKALTAWSPIERRLCFLLPFVMRICLWFLRISPFGGGNPETFSHVLLQDLVSIVGGVIGAVHIPEKWYPGACDMYLNSHNIMHILVVAAVYYMHSATVGDLTWMSQTKCQLTGS